MGHTPALAAEPGATPRRSLTLAGGGMRVAWQAGVLRALDEAGLRFSHADGTSGGIFNLAMLLSGLSPVEMGERWQTLRTLDFVSPLPLRDYRHGLRLPALGGAQGIAERVFAHLGIEAERIREAEGLEGTFNVCDFAHKVSEAVSHRDIERDLLVAGVSLPVLMPAQRGRYLDAVWIRDANLLEGVRRGSEELWLAWCIGNTPTYRNGCFRQYVHMIEVAANGSLFGELERIAELNARIRAGEEPGGRRQPVRLHVIRPEVPIPLDPDYFLGRIDAGTLVAMGYRDAWRYLATCEPGGVALTPACTAMREAGPGVGLRLGMAGPVRIGDVPGILEARLALEVEDVEAFAAGGPGSLLGELRHPALGAAGALLRSGSVTVEGRSVRCQAGVGAPDREITLTGHGHLGPGRGLEITLRAADELIATGALRPRARELGGLALSLHARNAGSLPAGARAVMRFLRSVID